jgi:hypothetical protein
MPIEFVDPESVKRRLKFDYLKAKNDPAFQASDSFLFLLSYFHKPVMPKNDLVQEVANHLQKQYRLRWVMIGLRGDDGNYRYTVHSGMRQDAWDSQRVRVYKLSDFDIEVSGKYKAGEISKLTRVYLSEDNPLGAQDVSVLNRPVLMGSRRMFQDETLEADFINALIMGPDDSLLGWIEYSSTTAGRFPVPMVMRSMEVVASILAALLTHHSGPQRPGT